MVGTRKLHRDSVSDSVKRAHALKPADLVLKEIQVLTEMSKTKRGPTHEELVSAMSAHHGLERFTAQHMVRETHDGLRDKGLTSVGNAHEEGRDLIVYVITKEGIARAKEIKL
jgi:hypothetical protein